MILDIIRNIAMRVARAASDRKAEDVKVLDMRSVSPIADYFVICSCNSMVHLRAVATAILDEVKRDDLRVKRREGTDEARWVLIDLGDVIVHVFHHAEREFYDLDSLWADAPEVDWQAELGLEQDERATEQTVLSETAD
ncbi:MAG: ribosome silencing factor [Firmicutes bacterium]|nr:ribosome silencing factor [Bacillota bacterium]